MTSIDHGSHPYMVHVHMISSDTYNAYLLYFYLLRTQNMEKSTWNIKKDWFSDPSTYPIFVIMGCAMTFMTGAAVNALVRYKDVTIDPTKRNSKLQTWGAEKYHSNLEKVISWNAYGKEGLGVDHETWLKEKEAARKAR